MSIIISRNGKDAKRLERTVIQQEDYLQRYIHANPESLPLHELKEDLRLLILAREFPTRSGPIDALGVDGDGEIYIIETKLYKNPDKRVVVAQMLDYGAALWSAATDSAGFIMRLEEATLASLKVGLITKLCEFYGIEGDAVTEYMESVKANAAAGRFSFVVLMDRLDDRLRNLISFVNANSNFDLLGVELDFYQHDDFEIVIPSLYGAEQKKRLDTSATNAARRKWDETSFFEDAEQRLDAQQVEAVRYLLTWSRTHADEITWGTGAHSGSFNVKFEDVNPRSVFTVSSRGVLTLNFGWLREPEHSAKYAQELGARLREGEWDEISSDFMNKHVCIELSVWAPRLEQFTTILKDVVRTR